MNPTHTLTLKNISNYTDILKYFAKHNIEVYVYTIIWQGHILKFGISHKNGERRPLGDRIYTQAGYFPGWDKPCLSRGPKSKLATESIIKELEEKFNVKVHKDDIVIEIEDYTSYNFLRPDNPYAELQNVEEMRKKEYFEQHGRYPIGNKKQEGIRFVATVDSCGLFYTDEQ